MNVAKRVILWLGSFAHRALSATLWVGFGFIVITRGVIAADNSPPVGAADVAIRAIQQYWDLPSHEKREPHRFEIHCYVTYYDPAWRLLFIQDDAGAGAYVPLTPANTFPFKAGQRVLISGRRAMPDDNLSVDDSMLTVEGTGFPSPVDLVRRIAESDAFTSKFVVLEGLVDHYRRLSPRHLEMTLSSEGKSMTVWLQRELTDPIPDLSDAYVRVTGVYNPLRGPNGALQSYSILIPDISYLQIVSRLQDEPRFKEPVQPISDLSKHPAGQLVRIMGEVKAQEAGHFVTIRDRTGQVDVMTAQTRPCSINETIEAIGYTSIQGTEWKLNEGLFRAVVPSAIKSVDSVPVSGTLRLAAQVLELSPEQAKEGRAVTLTGVVTWSNPNSPFFFIQDASGGVCVMRGQSTSQLRAIGRNVEIHGFTGMGQFSPVVVANRYDKVSELVLPQAKQISLEHALSGVEEAQWVEMRGYLRRIDARNGLSELEIATSGGDFVAVLPGSENVTDLIGAVVRLHGVCTAVADEQRKLTGIKLWVPSASYVQTEEPAPKNNFDVPLHSLASLGQFGNLQSFTQRLRVAGVVLHHVPGHVIYLQDGSDTLPVFSRETEMLHPGDRIEAVGFFGRQGGRIGLREAVYRKTGSAPEPSPKLIHVGSLPATAEDGRLVKLEGLLIDSSSTGGQLRLTLQASNTIFEAFLETNQAGVVAGKIENGSDLALTGVYEVKFDEYMKPAAFQLHLRTREDIVVQQHPSWFTRQRILAFAGTLALGTVIFMAWVASLRRRVRAQTEQIREQVQRESWLKDELQRASKIESLGLLAGGIAHDFNNLLTVMMGNLSLVRLDSTLTRDSVQSLHSAERAALRARDLTQQLLTFSKGGAPIRAAVSLPEVVREVAEFALRGSKTRCDFDIPDDLWPANVDKGQIGQVVQNIVINAMQAMAEGGQIEISLRNTSVGEELGKVLLPGRYVLLSISDHGPGIRTADLQHIFDPYFTTKKTGNGLGLATVYSIIKKHLGHISAESVPGRETTFRIWLPAADGSPAAAEPLRKTPSSAPIKDNATVLFMDDEETIRNLGHTLLSRMGYSVTTTSEGVETIREYKRAWAAKHPYDLVILDLTIPGGMGGRETMEELLKFDSSIRAIVSSGYSNDLVLANYHAHGFRGMISKPYEITDFSHAIEQVLRGVRA